MQVAGSNLLRIVLFVPRLIGSVFTAPPEELNRDIPDELCCEITYELLQDPVYFNGKTKTVSPIFVSLHIALLVHRHRIFRLEACGDAANKGFWHGFARQFGNRE